MNAIQIRTPFAIFLGDVVEPGWAKTGFGLVEWRREHCAGQLALPGCPIDLGVRSLSLAQLPTVANSLVIGVAARGGVIPEAWMPSLVSAARAGVDIVSGGHQKLVDIPELVSAVHGSGAMLVDVRIPPAGIPVATGAKRSGSRVLTVGTDCAVGKKYTALALERAMRARGLVADFRATGQTGIMIAGTGIPIDATVCDFTAGAAEILSPENGPEHWDVIEGQGSLFHPSYAGVSLALLHGSQPDAIVLCHDATRSRILGLDAFSVPSLNDAIALNLQLGRLTNPAVFCAGIAVNTARVKPSERGALLQRYQEETALPCVDPLVEGVGAIIDRLAPESMR